MNHVRYTFYWEAYAVNPTAFMNELQMVANAMDKYGIKVIYDNHQFHTSSYLNPSENGFHLHFSKEILNLYMAQAALQSIKLRTCGGQIGGIER